ADPRMASAYFVKASALYKQSKLEHGKLTVPAGTKEALEKYLELDPSGGNAAVAREMLAKIGTTIDTTFKTRTKLMCNTLFSVDGQARRSSLLPCHCYVAGHPFCHS